MKRAPLLIALAFSVSCASAPGGSSASQTQAPRNTVAPVPSASRGAWPDLDHQRVDYWVERFSKGDKQPEIAAAFARKPEVEAVISEKLRRRGMPQELVYLAMAESGLNPAAHSIADAVGVWQLTPATARQWGLRVDDAVDERRDLAKSTDAALSYLSALYNQFGSWYLAAAGYNAGGVRVAQLLTAANGEARGTDADFYRLWEQFPGETRDYVPAMAALARIGRDPSRYGFSAR